MYFAFLTEHFYRSDFTNPFQTLYKFCRNPFVRTRK